MKTLYKTLIAAAVLSTGTMAIAQEATRTGYFSEGYTFRHELNPAFGGEHNYFSVPALGNLGISAMSNIGVNTFLYKLPNGQLTTFMSPTVDASTFLNKLGNNNKLNLNVNEVILSAGWKAWGGFSTITLSSRVDAGVNLPKDLLSFMKLGQVGDASQYNFKDLRVDANAMAEIALGHSRQITPELRAGAKLNILLGIGNVSAKIDNMDIRMSGEQWLIDANGSLDIAAGTGLRVPTKQETGADISKPEDADLIEWNDIKYDNFGLSGFGMTLDLGVTYDMGKLVDGLELSASILDLGFMSWNHTISGATANKPWTFDGFQNIAISSNQPGYEDNKIDEQFDRLWDDMQDCINFHRTQSESSRTTMPAATLSLGASYKMPFYKKLSAGFLFTQHCHSIFSWTEGRFSANVAPTKWFDAAVSFGAGTYGSSFGWVINFHPRGFNFFLGSDHQFFKVTPQYVPVGHTSAAINLGFNITFG